MESGSHDQPPGPALTAEQRRVAAALDHEVRQLLERGADDLAIFGTLAERGLPQFKWLVDTTTLDGLNALCVEFAGFRHYAELLETISRSMLLEPPDGVE
jgi:hypothetical protein